MLLLPWAARTRPAAASVGAQLEKFIQKVPLPGDGIVVATERTRRVFVHAEPDLPRQLHPQLPPTPFWAYDDGSGLDGQAGSFGMAVVAQSGTPVRSASRTTFQRPTRAGFRSTPG